MKKPLLFSGIKIRNKEVFFLLSLLAYLLLLTTFPNNNPSSDAFAYAAQVKYGTDLFLPHHLLYNAFLWIITQPIIMVYPNLDILSLSAFVNSLFAASTLFVLYSILKRLNISFRERLIFLGIVAFSFNFLRYSTENETYIIPLFFSLLATFYFLLYDQRSKSKFLFLTGFFSTTSCLFHQLHCLWLIGLFFGLIFFYRKRSQIMIFCTPLLLIPLVYTLVFCLTEKTAFSIQGIFQFALHDYIYGTAEPHFKIDGIVMGFISIVRSFLEVHPKVLLLIKHHWLFYLPLLLALFYGIYLFYLLIKKCAFHKRERINIPFLRTIVLILGLHVVFAFYSYGNVEFMVMLPTLTILTLFYCFKFHVKMLMLTVCTFFAWNISYGLWPNHNLKLRNDAVIVEFVNKNKTAFFIVDNQTPINQFYYKYGTDEFSQFLHINTLHPKKIDHLHFGGNDVYTNLIDKPIILDRQKLTAKKNGSTLLDHFFAETVLEYPSFYGPNKIVRIIKR